MQGSFPVDRYPGPVCRYDLEDQAPVVRDVDEAFETRFGPVEAGVPAREVFDRFETAGEQTAVERTLDGGGRLRLRWHDTAESAERYVCEAVPPTADAAGYLLFRPSGAGDGAADSGELGVDHVASVISHDLRNPLDVAKARLTAAREYDEPEHFEQVTRAHERMERIIQDVLTLTRGEDAVDPDADVEIGAVAEQAWETVETDGADLTVDDPLPTTVADPDRVSRLFENLFRNCVEHGATNDRKRADEGAVSVVVAPLESADGAGFLVADDGPGIPPSDRDRVLEPGYSSDDHGTGLGLAIVEKIADAHGWTVRVATADTGGARIEVHGL